MFLPTEMMIFRAGRHRTAEPNVHVNGGGGVSWVSVGYSDIGDAVLTIYVQFRPVFELPQDTTALSVNRLLLNKAEHPIVSIHSSPPNIGLLYW